MYIKGPRVTCLGHKIQRFSFSRSCKYTNRETSLFHYGPSPGILKLVYRKLIIVLLYLKNNFNLSRANAHTQLKKMDIVDKYFQLIKSVDIQDTSMFMCTKHQNTDAPHSSKSIFSKIMNYCYKSQTLLCHCGS